MTSRALINDAIALEKLRHSVTNDIRKVLESYTKISDPYCWAETVFRDSAQTMSAATQATVAWQFQLRADDAAVQRDRDRLAVDMERFRAAQQLLDEWEAERLDRVSHDSRDPNRK